MAGKSNRKIDEFPKAFMLDHSGRFDFNQQLLDYTSGKDFDLTNTATAKVIVIGDVSVGKTSLINKYCHHVFDKDYKTTIGVDFEVEEFDIKGVRFQLQLWDTAGQERFQSITKTYYRNANAIVIAFECQEEPILENVRTWFLDAVEENKNRDFNLYIVGTKCDLCKESELEKCDSEAIKLAEELDAEYWRTSAKEGINIDDMFNRVAVVACEEVLLKQCEKRQAVKLGDIGTGIRPGESKDNIRGCCV